MTWLNINSGLGVIVNLLYFWRQPRQATPRANKYTIRVTSLNSMESQPLITLAFEGHPIRCFDFGEYVEWVEADVYAALNLGSIIRFRAIEKLVSDEKVTRTAYILGDQQQLVTITEAGLYNLLCYSDKTVAKRFKRWLCSEVIMTMNQTENNCALSTQLAVANGQIQKLSQRLELAEIDAQETQKAVLSANERAVWSEWMNELSIRQLEQQRQTIAELTDQLTRTQKELNECQHIIIQTAYILGGKAIEIQNQGD